MIEHIKDKIKAVFSDLIFDEQNHRYFVGGVQLPSVSGKVESHAHKFDETFWLPKCAKKEGVTEHELRHKWQTTNKLACDLGTETHDFLEKYDGIQTPQTPQQKAGVDFFNDILKTHEIIFRELRMYSKKFWYAGTTDLLLRNNTTGNLVLADYKTNKDLFKSYGMLKPPFQYLDAHPFAKYCLQLSYYQIPLEEINCTISERMLVYLMADGQYKTYMTADFSSELINTMNSQQKKDTYASW